MRILQHRFKRWRRNSRKERGRGRNRHYQAIRSSRPGCRLRSQHPTVGRGLRRTDLWPWLSSFSLRWRQGGVAYTNSQQGTPGPYCRYLRDVHATRAPDEISLARSPYDRQLYGSLLFYDASTVSEKDLRSHDFLCKDAPARIASWRFRLENGKWKAVTPLFDSGTDALCGA